MAQNPINSALCIQSEEVEVLNELNRKLEKIDEHIKIVQKEKMEEIDDK